MTFTPHIKNMVISCVSLQMRYQLPEAMAGMTYTVIDRDTNLSPKTQFGGAICLAARPPLLAHPTQLTIVVCERC